MKTKYILFVFLLSFSFVLSTFAQDKAAEEKKAAAAAPAAAAPTAKKTMQRTCGLVKLKLLNKIYHYTHKCAPPGKAFICKNDKTVYAEPNKLGPEDKEAYMPEEGMFLDPKTETHSRAVPMAWICDGLDLKKRIVKEPPAGKYSAICALLPFKPGFLQYRCAPPGQKFSGCVYKKVYFDENIPGKYSTAAMNDPKIGNLKDPAFELVCDNVQPAAGDLKAVEEKN